MRTTFLTAALTLGLLGAAAAQTAAPATDDAIDAPIPQDGTTVQVEGGAEIGTTLGAGALPGVGIGTATTTETNAESGPGGLQNGVGATGVIAPDLSGSAGTTTGGVPSSSSTTGLGVPVETTPGAED